jgi:cytochrome c556
MKFFACLATAATLLTVVVPASAQFAKPEDAVKYRQSALSVMGTHFGRLGAMANGKVPFDAKVAADNAQLVAVMARLPWAGFGPGTDKDPRSKAMSEVWTEQAKFQAASEKLVVEADKMAAATKTGNLDALKTSFGATADSCKSCHDTFRNK